MNPMRAICLLMIVALIPMGAAACDEESKVGYWWYCEPESSEENEETLEFPERKPLAAPPAQQEMMKMHPDDIAVLQERYLKEAVWQTTPQNVLNYYRVLDVTRKKSLAFMNVTNLVMLKNPELNAYAQYTKTNPSRKALTQHKTAELRAMLAHHQNNYGLILFTKSTCIYCKSQYATLASFSDRHGWPMKAIDIDEDPVAAVRFNVSTVPVTIIVKKGSDNWMPVAVGDEALTTIEMNVYRGIRYLNGDTTPSQFLQMEHDDYSVSDPDYVTEARR